MKFRKKPVTVEAIQWTGDNEMEIYDFSNGKVLHIAESTKMLVPTLEGDMQASVGDWIIRGVQGEYYPCKPDIFAATYEPEAPQQTGHADTIEKITKILNERLHPDNLDVRVAAGTTNTYNIQVSSRATGPRWSFWLRARDGAISESDGEGGSWSGMIARHEWLTSAAYALFRAGIKNFYIHIEEL